MNMKDSEIIQAILDEDVCGGCDCAACIEKETLLKRIKSELEAVGL
jgi:hypothetical protein